ncbi:acetyl-CoA carboxylase biotin carboxyl carrier protein [Sunxiuqinia elliptica]|uniref:Biotin-dependent enzyme n=1 Tax=Sunxiuqinia elliptica TaxID=655355 RepID=A0A1I2JHC2_9BACT|nr:biotin/lipoyl-containing protein [Sunxiuqinia elliptica]TDN98937.1 biotin-dependent enzyme [Sunxiuqinia elliptica]TDO56378.1 biotin-dependent enzyme [Sunxiuqinia elliptica]SFF52081.1 Biotin-requiring enzyme [Sunxiuqinia elliptica]
MKKYKFTISGDEYDVNIKDFEDNVAQIEVNGTQYSVELKGEVKASKTPKLVRKPVVQQPGEGQIKKKQSSGGMQVKAPLPGTIFKMHVAVGDQVKEGDTLLIMEAMKMENQVLAEKAGQISAVKVKEGDAVLQDDVLIEIS